jgi:putative membrane protein
MYTPTDVYGYLTMVRASDEITLQASRLALRRSGSEAVRAHAQAMIEQHTLSAQALTEAAQRSALHPQPAVLTGTLQRRLDGLFSVADAGFDEAYLTAEAEVQRQALAAHRTYAERGDNALLRAVAALVAPQVQAAIARTEALRGGPSGAPGQAAP